MGQTQGAIFLKLFYIIADLHALADEIAGCHHWCNRYELGQTLRDGEGQGGLECCSPLGHKELDMTGQVNKI